MKITIYTLMAAAFALTPAFAEGEEATQQAQSGIQSIEASAQGDASQAIQEVADTDKKEEPKKEEAAKEEKKADDAAPAAEHEHKHKKHKKHKGKKHKGKHAEANAATKAAEKNFKPSCAK
jgi:hypothetical protein